MLLKDRQRAVRRWRSHCVWMRRLKIDWNDHGWKRDPIIHYEFPNGTAWVNGEPPEAVAYVDPDRTTLCECFDLKAPEAMRFKDTPNRWSFPRGDWDKYRNGRGGHIPVQEKRAAPEDEEGAWRKTEGGNNIRKYPRRVQCLCGYFLGWAGHESGRERCKDCERRQKAM